MFSRNNFISRPVKHFWCGTLADGDRRLTDFSPTDRLVVEEAIAKVGEAVPVLLEEGLAAAMNKYNQKEAPSP